MDKIHGGKLEGTEGSRAATLDQTAKTIGLQRLDFIKLDVDGHEPEVLCGGLDTIRRFRPRILMEWAPYLYKPKDHLLREAMHALEKFGYRSRIAESSKKSVVLTEKNTLPAHLVEGVSVNLLFEYVA